MKKLILSILASSIITIAQAQHHIGEHYQGGIIAYILQPGDPGYVAGQTHGLIAAPSDQTTGPGNGWGYVAIKIPGARHNALGTGRQNTAAILDRNPEAGLAARLCSDLVLNGYSDWYLPSIMELNKLYLNRMAIGGFVISGWDWYWSSSERGSTEAWYMKFHNGWQRTVAKNGELRVRAVRSF